MKFSFDLPDIFITLWLSD